MAYADYIHCEICDEKLIYDGGCESRQWIQDDYNIPCDMFSQSLICPACLKKERQEKDGQIKQLQKDCADYAYNLDQFRKENDELRKRLKWQPIETAPEGEAILLFNPEALSGRYHMDSIIRVGFRGDWPNRPASHWMPLPEPPRKEGGE